jgi:signal transduction histidine kinase
VGSAKISATGSTPWRLLSARFPRGPAASARRLVLIMIGVVVCFVAATALSQYQQSQIDREVESIVGNAMPSVRSLSLARVDLHRLDAQLLELVIAHRATTADLDAIDRYRAGMRSSLEDYLAQPFFAAERGLYDELVARQVTTLHEALDRIREVRSEDGDGEMLMATLIDAHRTTLALDEGLQRMVDFNASQGQRLGLSIERVRRRSVDLLWVLEMLTVGLAAVATVVAFRNLQRTTALLEESRRNAEARASHSEERAKELELFAGRVAHDLRSPLAGIALRVSVAERKAGIGTPMESLVGQLKQYLVRMDLMIAGLLEFARSGAKAEPSERGNLSVVLKDAVAGLNLEASAARVTLELDARGPGPVACSQGMLTSVVMNLMRNALKYIQVGERTERRIIARMVQRTGWVRVEIEDTGPGMPGDALERIFQPFVRLDTEQPGIGLGLATVKRIVESHAGRVGVESVEGEGSCFWFELPAVEAPSVAHEGLSPRTAT